MSKDNAQLVLYDGIKFQYGKFNYATFKQKEIFILRNIFEYSRLSDGAKFEGYTTMLFDEVNDPKHIYPKFNVFTEFDRKNTHGLVYDITDIPYNVGNQYDKLIIYHYLGKLSFYGFVLYNSETKVSSNTFIIEHNETSLFSRISYSFHIMENFLKFKKLDEHRKLVFDTVKPHTGLV